MSDATIPYRVKNITGRVLFRWTVMSFAGTRQRGAYWLCRCECGTIREVSSATLLHGRSKSCGCLHREVLSELNAKHGGCDSPEYSSWKGMIARCTNADRKGYDDYGGRGITVCERWSGENGFDNFISDMGPKPSPAHSIDRFPDNDGNYEPGNCRWATEGQQKRNMRSNRMVTFRGKTLCITDWAKEIGIAKETLRARFRKGWSIERALTIPAQN